MSDQSKIRSQLDAVKEAYTTDYGVVEESLTEGMSGLKARIRNFNIELQEKAKAPKKETTPKYTQSDIANRAIDTYKTKVNPVNPEFEADESQPSTHASRTNMKSMARALAGMRSSGNGGETTQTTENGNGDVGQYTSPAGPNGGDLGNNTAFGQYYTLTTTMTLEEYQEHINKKFETEEPTTPLVCGVCAEHECVCEEELEESPVEDLKNQLREMTDYSWQAIDKVMRKIAKEYDITPKQLHKDFKSQEGMIPDDWAKVNEEVQLYGYMPLDEAVAINKIGQVYEVTCLWRGGTHRLKFFWRELRAITREEAQEACCKFYPGCRLLAHYPVKDDPENYMVIVPQMKEAAEFVPLDTWAVLPEAADDFYNFICEEVGEPVTPMIYHDDTNEYHLLIENHDTGEEQLIVAEAEGLHAWFNKSSSGGKGGWVQAGGRFDGKPCARQPGQKSTPKCVSSSKRASMSKSERASAHRRKNAADPNQGSKTGAAKPTYVSTDKPKTKKEEYEPMDEACWKGYTKKGMKKMFGKMYPNCVKKTKSEGVEYVDEGKGMEGMTQKGGHKRSTESGAGLTQKGVEKYRRQNPGSKLQTAVTTPPSKLKPGSKAANRRKSFCARSRGWTGERGKAARRRWNC